MIKKTSFKEVDVDKFIDAIKKLPSDEIKNQWLRWLSEYDGPGYYNRLAGMDRSAKWAYNHLANPEMLLWLVQAAGVNKDLVKLAKSDCNQIINVNRAAGIIRKRIPWAELEHALW
jgi:hypothetical protein